VPEAANAASVPLLAGKAVGINFCQVLPASIVLSKYQCPQ
jgi:hypothetical protein